MTNPSLLRELVRSDKPRRHSGNIEITLARRGPDSLLESVIARGSIPYASFSIALLFSNVGEYDTRAPKAGHRHSAISPVVREQVQ